MPQISKYKVKDRVLNKIYELFFSLLGNQYKKEEFEGILFELLSPTEKVMITKRITLIYLLLKGIKYKTISDVLKVSTSTISKFSILIKESNFLIQAINSIVKRDKFTQVIDKFFTEIIPSGRTGLKWQGNWEKELEIERKKIEGI